MINTIRENRKQHALTQEALAQKIGVSRQTIHAIEKGYYTPSTVLALKLSKIFGKTVNDLFFLELED